MYVKFDVDFQQQQKKRHTTLLDYLLNTLVIWRVILLYHKFKNV